MTTVINSCENPVKLTLLEPLSVETFEEAELNFVEYGNHDESHNIDNLRKQNLKNLRLNHCNQEEYDYEIMYKKGKQNTNADALSRIQLNAIENESLINYPGNIDQEISEFLSDNYDPTKISEEDVQKVIEEIERPKEKDNPTDIKSKKEKIRIISDIQVVPPFKDRKPRMTNTIHTTNAENNDSGLTILDEIINNKKNQIIVKKSPYEEYSKIDREIFDGNKIVKATLPLSLNKIIQFFKEYLSEKTTYIYFQSEELRPLCNKAMINNFQNYKLIECKKLINNVKENERKLLIQYKHEGKTNHRGIEETIKFLKSNYYWKSLKADVTEYINQCEICQRTKYNRRPINQPLMITETPSKPFEILHIDTLKIGNDKFLTVIDKFSKYGQALPYLGDAISCSDQLIRYFSFMGIPKKIIADNGTEFKNEVVENLLKTHGIETHFTTPYHHESNSPIERLHSTLIEHIRILRETDTQTDVTNLMPYAIVAYNNTIHSDTDFTPQELVLGHTNSRDPMNLIHSHVYTEYLHNHKNNTQILFDKIKEKSQEKKEKVVLRRNDTKTETKVKIGTQVYKKLDQRSSKIKNKFTGPYKVTKILERNKIEIENPKTKTKEIVHINETKVVPIVADVSTSPQPSTSEQAK